MPRRLVTLSMLLAAISFTAFDARFGNAKENAAAPQLLPDELIAAGWLQLFDGQTLFGWQATSDANWHVENGELRVDAGTPSWLMSTVDWADYELHLEFKAPTTSNSGVFLRSALEPTDPQADCVEVNIAPRDNPFPTPSLVGRQKIDLSHGGKTQRGGGGYNNVAGLDAWDGHWHSLDISVSGQYVEVRFDGATPSVYFSEENNYGAVIGEVPARGRIGLQFHDGAIAFRNIRLRPLNLQPIFNGKDLAGWNADEARASKFQVTDDGALQILNGRGQLESDASYGDFVLQLQCFVNGDALNSGVFFRCIPREFTNGYESQIQNAYLDGDPTAPADFGTGGIYRRVPARRIVAGDREWFSKTIVATGPHIAVWVNGYPVTAWTDDRPPHDNPRNGLRTAPGALALQGHDPTTDIRFREMKIGELPPAPETE